MTKRNVMEEATRLHKLISEMNPDAPNSFLRSRFIMGDTHIGVAEHAEICAGISEQLIDYGRLAGVDEIVMVMGGDIMHGDLIVDIETRPYDLVTSCGSKSALMGMMRKIPDEPEVTPRRTPRKRDWEQRNRKQRR